VFINIPQTEAVSMVSQIGNSIVGNVSPAF